MAKRKTTVPPEEQQDMESMDAGAMAPTEADFSTPSPESGAPSPTEEGMPAAEEGQPPADTDQSAANRDSRTEADKFSVPQCLKVCTPEIFQQQQRQRRPEDKSVDFLYKTFIQQSDLTKSISQKHCKKDRQRGI